jgi:hypothetical protein
MQTKFRPRIWARMSTHFCRSNDRQNGSTHKDARFHANQPCAILMCHRRSQMFIPQKFIVAMEPINNMSEWTPLVVAGLVVLAPVVAAPVVAAPVVALWNAVQVAEAGTDGVVSQHVLLSGPTMAILAAVIFIPAPHVIVLPPHLVLSGLQHAASVHDATSPGHSSVSLAVSLMFHPTLHVDLAEHFALAEQQSATSVNFFQATLAFAESWNFPAPHVTVLAPQ